jgi:transcriptional regulator with XRE-family HTH domain
MEQQHISNAKFQLTERLKDWKHREAYVRASINVNLPSQIRALRLRRQMSQNELAVAAQMKQPRISAMEKPGATKFNVETLVRVAAAFRVGLIVKFVSISEMLAWENRFSQDSFNVVTFEQDRGLLPAGAPVNNGRFSSTPTWFSVSAPGPMRALPEQVISPGGSTTSSSNQVRNSLEGPGQQLTNITLKFGTDQKIGGLANAASSRHPS